MGLDGPSRTIKVPAPEPLTIPDESPAAPAPEPVPERVEEPTPA